MPGITGYITEEQEDFIEKKLVENGPFDSKSEVLEKAIDYYLHNKYGR